MNLPNIVTMARILMVPVIFWLVATKAYQAAFMLFLLAGASDALDGYLAKRFGWESELGAHLDPLADKLLLVSVYVAMGANGALPLWLVTAVVSRDVLIVAAVLLAWLLANPVKVRPLLISKATTFFQIALAAFVLCELAYDLGYDLALNVLIWSTGALTALSLAAYMRAWIAHMSGTDVQPMHVRPARKLEPMDLGKRE